MKINHLNYCQLVCHTSFISGYFQGFSIDLWCSEPWLLYAHVVFFIFILLGICWASCIGSLCLSPNLQKFQPFFLQVFFPSHSLSFPSKILTPCLLDPLTLPHSSLNLSSCSSKILLLSYLQIRSFILVYLHIHCLFPLLSPFCTKSTRWFLNFIFCNL